MHLADSLLISSGNFPPQNGINSWSSRRDSLVTIQPIVDNVQHETHQITEISTHGPKGEEEVSSTAIGSLEPAAHTDGQVNSSPTASLETYKMLLLFTNILSVARYQPDLASQYLTFMQDMIVPALSSTPRGSEWIPHLTHNGSPFEPSINLQSGKQVARFTFEPLGPLSGTNLDPSNQSPSLIFISSLSKSGICPSLHLKWWDHFTSEFFMSPSSSTKDTQVEIPNGKAPPTCFLAFDLSPSEFEVVLKPYLFPHRRALFDGKSTTEVVFEAVKKLDLGLGVSITSALDKVETFLTARASAVTSMTPVSNIDGELVGRNEIPGVISNLDGEEKEMSIEMLSFDCIDPSKSQAQPRIKMYAKSTQTSLSDVLATYIMDGERFGPIIDEGLVKLTEFWACLFGFRYGWDAYDIMASEPHAGMSTEDQHVVTNTSPKFLFYGFEIAPGREEVDVKLYIPIWTTGLSRTVVTERLGRYFRGLGWDLDIGVSHQEVDEAGCGLEGIWHGDNIEAAGAGYTYISFAYSSKKGAYVTLYCSP